MSYLALYRQWRPQDFENLIGQEHINTTLKNAIATNRIAHAYLFTGPRGTGKTSTAKILAKAINCEKGPCPEPCNLCAACKRITDGTAMDVVEIDAASNRGIDEIRDLRETIKFAPVEGRKKIYIIDEVHMLTTEAFNALLKTLEEPPEHVIFILATTEPHRIPATVHSRCQRYDFRRISVADIEARLLFVAQNSGINITQEAIKLIAVHAAGGMRDALSILDQCASMDTEEIGVERVRELLGLIGNEWVGQMAEYLLAKDAASSIIALDKLIALGKDARQALLELVLHMRSLMLYKAAPNIEPTALHTTDIDTLKRQSKLVSHGELTEMIAILQEGASEARWASEMRISVEMALLLACRRSGGEDVAALLERVEKLEQRLATMTFGAESVRAEQAAPAKTIVDAKPAAAAAVRPQDMSPTSIKGSEVSRDDAKRAEMPATLNDDELKSVWDKVLKQLLAEKRRTVHACVAQGSLQAVDDKAATIAFDSQFAKDRTEKEDFRTIMEKILRQIIGREVKLKGVLAKDLAESKKKQPTAKEKNSAAKSMGEQEPMLTKALEIFGGRIVTDK